MTFFHAQMTTPNFEFEGFGTTEYAATEALRVAWNSHVEYSKQNGREVPLFDEKVKDGEDDPGKALSEHFDMTVNSRELDQGYRDGHPLGSSSGLRSLYRLLEAAERGRGAALADNPVNPYLPGTPEFKAFHMSLNMTRNPGERPF